MRRVTTASVLIGALLASGAAGGEGHAARTSFRVMDEGAGMLGHSEPRHGAGAQAGSISPSLSAAFERL